MTTFKTLTALALVALVASTSLASAGTIIPHGSKPTPTPLKPIQDPKPKMPYIPIDFPPAKPAKPDITIIPGIIDVMLDHSKATDRPVLMVDCMVKDNAPTTDDMWIVNVGSTDLPAGVKIRFAVPSTGDHGAFLLNRSIASGHKAKVADLLHDARSGAPCRAQIL